MVARFRITQEDRRLTLNYCTNSTGVSILLIIFLASLNRDLSQESRCDVVITTKS
jgi:hypothetical protein